MFTVALQERKITCSISQTEFTTKHFYWRSSEWVVPSSHWFREMRQKEKTQHPGTRRGQASQGHAPAILKKQEAQPKLQAKDGLSWTEVRSPYFCFSPSLLLFFHHSIIREAPMEEAPGVTCLTPAHNQDRGRSEVLHLVLVFSMTVLSIIKWHFQSSHSHCFKGWNVWFESNGHQPHKMATSLIKWALILPQTFSQLAKSPRPLWRVKCPRQKRIEFTS